MEKIDFTMFQFEQIQELEQMNYDKMVEVQFNENILKQNFKLIIKVLQSFSAGFKKLNVIDDINKKLDDYRKRIEALEKENKELKKEQDVMKNEQENQKKNINELQTQNTELRKTDAEQQKQINQLMEAFFKNRQEEQQKEIDELRDLLKKLQDKLNQFDDLKDKNISDEQLNQLRQQIIELIKQIEALKSQMEQFVTKSEFQAFSKQFEDLKSNFGQLKETELPLKFQQIQTQFDSMNDEIEKIKLQIRQIYDIINQLGTGQKEIIIPEVQPSVDPSKLKDLEKRVFTLETKQKEHLTQYAKDQSALNEFKKNTQERLSDLSENKLDKKDFKQFMKDIQDQINKLHQENQLTKSQIREIETQINNILKKLGSMDGRRKSSAKQVIQQGLTAQEAQKMIDSAINKLRDELLALINQLQDALKNKVDTDEHYNTIQEILKKIDDIVNSILKKCADSNDTKKALIFLDKKIQDLYLLLAGDKQCHDDGLFVKRPLFWSCASCDKDLDKFNGRLGQYKNWAVFPPKETSPERMARFGIGYAKYVDAKKQKLEREKEIAGIYLDSNYMQARPTTAQPHSNYQDNSQNDSKSQLPNVHGSKINKKHQDSQN